MGVSVEFEALSLALQTPKCLPPLLWGKPGIGKSSKIEQLAERLGAHLEVVIAAVHEPADFGGYPAIAEGTLQFMPPAWAKRAAEAKRAIVLMDDISCTPPAVQAGLLRVTLEGVIGDFVLPETVRFVAAANPTDQAAGGWDLADPLANRYVHLPWPPPTLEEWGSWLTGESQTFDTYILDTKLFEEYFNRAKSEVMGFLRARPTLLYQDRSPEGLPAFATPRTWEAATRLIAACSSFESTIVPKHKELEKESKRETKAVAEIRKIMNLLVSGCVGRGPAVEFVEWKIQANLPNPEDLLRDPRGFEHDPLRPDRTYAVLISVALAGIRDTEDPKEKVVRWHAAWNFLSMLYKTVGKDNTVPAIRILIRGWIPGERATKEIANIIDEVRPVLRASGQIKKGG
jgi:hypothetical protein